VRWSRKREVEHGGRDRVRGEERPEVEFSNHHVAGCRNAHIKRVLSRSSPRLSVEREYNRPAGADAVPRQHPSTVETTVAMIQHISKLPRRRTRRSSQREDEGRAGSAASVRARRKTLREERKERTVTCSCWNVLPLGVHRLLLAGCVLSESLLRVRSFPTLSQNTFYVSYGAESGYRLPAPPLPRVSPTRASSPASPHAPSPALAQEDDRATPDELSDGRPHRELLLSASPAPSPSALPRTVAGHPTDAQLRGHPRLARPIPDRGRLDRLGLARGASSPERLPGVVRRMARRISRRRSRSRPF
jgi:hypothetical protein